MSDGDEGRLTQDGVTVDYPEAWHQIVLDGEGKIADNVDEIAAIAEEMNDEFASYDFAIDEVEIIDEGKDGKFIERDGTTVQIELGAYSRLIPVAGEELGHDLFHELVDDQITNDLTTLERATVNEAVANLCSRSFTDALDDSYGPPYTPTVFAYGNRKAFEGAFEALDTGHREREQDLLQDVTDMLEEDEVDWEAVWDTADDLADVPPYSGRTRMNGIHDTGYIANVFVHNLSMGEIEQNKRSIKALAGILYENEHDNEDAAQEAVEEVYDGGSVSYVPTRVRDAGYEFLTEDDYEAIKREMIENGPMGHVTLEDLREQQLRYNAEAILERAVERTADKTLDLLDEYMDEIEERDHAELLLEAVADERYARAYDISMDFPHSVGGQFADDMYQSGVEPRDIVDDPDPYVSQCCDRLRTTVRDWATFVGDGTTE